MFPSPRLSFPSQARLFLAAEALTELKIVHGLAVRSDHRQPQTVSTDADADAYLIILAHPRWPGEVSRLNMSPIAF